MLYHSYGSVKTTPGNQVLLLDTIGSRFYSNDVIKVKYFKTNNKNQDFQVIFYKNDKQIHREYLDTFKNKKNNYYWTVYLLATKKWEISLKLVS